MNRPYVKVLCKIKHPHQTTSKPLIELWKTIRKDGVGGAGPFNGTILTQLIARGKRDHCPPRIWLHRSPDQSNCSGKSPSGRFW